MKRNTVSFSFAENERRLIKNKMLNWLRSFSIFSYMDNNEYGHGPCRYEMLAGCNAIQTKHSLDLPERDWWLGHISYDLKNAIEPKLQSNHINNTGFEDVLFFQPETVVYIKTGSSELHVATLKEDADAILDAILAMPGIVRNTHDDAKPHWNYRFQKERYIEVVERIRKHIEAGDCYELNFCTEAYCEAVEMDAVYRFYKLNSLNPSPFAALYRNETKWLLCASPERFIYRENDMLLSQPIKGTARRSKDAVTDEALKQALLHDRKERAENVMIVDLVRNDLAKSCEPGSVIVPELFGVYSFPQVHQLISTVCGKIKEGCGNETIIKNAFPMGSMTGAPKVMVMQLIEQYELSRRGLYSGSVGYIDPEGNFDFNVVIRSLLYHETSKYLSYQTGGAITYESVAEAEWEEVRLKANAMEQIFL
ncbi:anthranilate synthase component I family protein [Taibaiella lutea]|uniref:Anthranilate synthase component I family protein n=1 Tax=Taibaiella lutea TaxID=2608001 RepID=A0A5M6CNK8_9BACT|nr:anthranilate synthase component I family protein [Taibaiella lutea]KAA5536724.1 anthranilate synthase component I family protein [Taibaiella lutea]